MKAMRKVSRGTGFRGVLDYAFNREPSAESPGKLVGGNMSGISPRELASEFGAVRRLRQDIGKPVWHQALRLPEGERINSDKWQSICDRYLTLMGISDGYQRVYIEHSDSAGQHVHIVANRIGIDGSVFLGRNENLLSTRVVAQLEVEFGLQITKGADYDPVSCKSIMPDAKVPTKNEIDKAVRTGDEPPRQKLQRLVDAARMGQPNAVQFCERLESAGVEVHANIASTGKFNGFSFGIGGVSFKASQLGDRYKWSRLLLEVGYDQVRDGAGLERFCGATRDGAQRVANAAANPVLAPANDRSESISSRGSEANKSASTARARAGNTTPSACIDHHKEDMASDQPRLRVADTWRVRCTTNKIDWLDFNVGDSTYYYKDKAGSLIPMVKEVEDGLLMVGRVAPAKCRAMLDIMQANSWAAAVVSGGDVAFQKAVLIEALRRVPLLNLRFTNADIDHQYQAHRCTAVISKPNPAFRLPHATQQERTHNQTVR